MSRPANVGSTALASGNAIAIRDEAPADVAAIEAVTLAAFRDAPHADHTEHRVVAALRRRGKLAVSLVAETDRQIVGHVALSPVAVSDGSAGWHGLGPISVLPGHQGRGVGSLLIRTALARLRAGGATGCVVLGDPGWYTRFGFRADPGLVLPDVPPEYFLALPFAARTARGVVTYDDAFSAA